jgi:hypothetical protein
MSVIYLESLDGHDTTPGWDKIVSGIVRATWSMSDANLTRFTSMYDICGHVCTSYGKHSELLGQTDTVKS